MEVLKQVTACWAASRKNNKRSGVGNQGSQCLQGACGGTDQQGERKGKLCVHHYSQLVLNLSFIFKCMLVSIAKFVGFEQSCIIYKNSTFVTLEHNM